MKDLFIAKTENGDYLTLEEFIELGIIEFIKHNYEI